MSAVGRIWLRNAAGPSGARRGILRGGDRRPGRGVPADPAFSKPANWFYAAGGLVTRAAQRYVTSRYIEGARALAAEGTEIPVIFIVVKFKVKPDWSERWLDLVDRLHPGNPAGARQPLVRLVPQPGRPQRVCPGGGLQGRRRGRPRQQRALQAGHGGHAPGPGRNAPIISRQLDGDGWDRMGELTI